MVSAPPWREQTAWPRRGLVMATKSGPVEAETDGEAVAHSEVGAGAELHLALYRQMRLIRRFEDLVQSLFMKGEVHGTTHMYRGEEGGAVVVDSESGSG